MSRQAKFFLVVSFFLLISTVPGSAEVFTLRAPGSNGYTGLQSIAAGKKLFDEPIEINGLKLNLKISLIDIALTELISQLKMLDPKIRVAANSTSIMVTKQLPRGFIKRLLFIHTGRGLPILCFELQLPAKMPQPVRWPSVLPRTADAVTLQTIYFPKRQATYGMFSTSEQPAGAVRELSGKLMANGWKAVSGEYTLPAARGEIFLSSRSTAIMLLSVSDDGITTLYTRPLTKP